jgi:hypothetical protein
MLVPYPHNLDFLPYNCYLEYYKHFGIERRYKIIIHNIEFSFHWEELMLMIPNYPHCLQSFENFSDTQLEYFSMLYQWFINHTTLSLKELQSEEMKSITNVLHNPLAFKALDQYLDKEKDIAFHWCFLDLYQPTVIEGLANFTLHFNNRWYLINKAVIFYMSKKVRRYLKSVEVLDACNEFSFIGLTPDGYDRML